MFTVLLSGVCVEGAQMLANVGVPILPSGNQGEGSAAVLGCLNNSFIQFQKLSVIISVNRPGFDEICLLVHPKVPSSVISS